MSFIAHLAQILGRQLSGSARAQPPSAPRGAMIAGQVAGVAIGDIDDWRGDSLAMPLRDFHYFFKNLGFFPF